VKSADPIVSEPADPLVLALVDEPLDAFEVLDGLDGLDGLDVLEEDFALLLEHAASVEARRIGNARAPSAPRHLRFMVLLRV
jgi:hypothetical protein